jgi:hypothetical protein
MKVHRNLLWLRGSPELVDELLADKVLAKLVIARPEPGICAVRPQDHERLLVRLEKLGHTPQETGRW